MRNVNKTQEALPLDVAMKVIENPELPGISAEIDKLVPMIAKLLVQQIVLMMKEGVPGPIAWECAGQAFVWGVQEKARALLAEETGGPVEVGA